MGNAVSLFFGYAYLYLSCVVNYAQISSPARPVQMADDNALPSIPNLEYAEAIFHLSTPSLAHLHEKATNLLEEAIERDSSAPLLLYLHENPGTTKHIKWEQSRYDDLAAKNTKQLEEMDEAITKAEAEEGEMEVNEALRKKAEYLGTLCDYERAKEAYTKSFEKTVPAGAKIDMMFAQLRLSIFFNKSRETASLLDQTKSLIDAGGDWDRKNRYKAYQGIYLVSVRQFSEASTVLLDSISTFTSTELCSYEDIIKYAVTSGLISLSRTDLKQKVIDAPEVLASRQSMEDLESCVNSLYLSDYAPFFTSLASVQGRLAESRYTAPHVSYFIRALRLRAYNQLLQSYSSLSLQSMAKSFGVSVEWLDADLAKFVRVGKLSAVIDRVNGIVETRRSDGKNEAYAKVVAEGDKLLNKLQKYQNALIV